MSKCTPAFNTLVAARGGTGETPSMKGGKGGKMPMPAKGGKMPMKGGMKPGK